MWFGSIITKISSMQSAASTAAIVCSMIGFPAMRASCLGIPSPARTPTPPARMTATVLKRCPVDMDRSLTGGARRAADHRPREEAEGAALRRVRGGLDTVPGQPLRGGVETEGVWWCPGIPESPW
ncbi:hypothetical protein GCM10025783_28530 [Amnibacterium soli]|uniref:Uncharacterized protein n=1 Tax=Amnibacterium soli TaxID=1282736 RepID=A0ABP8ZDL7_9MICO